MQQIPDHQKPSFDLAPRIFMARWAFRILVCCAILFAGYTSWQEVRKKTLSYLDQEFQAGPWTIRIDDFDLALNQLRFQKLFLKDSTNQILVKSAKLSVNWMYWYNGNDFANLVIDSLFYQKFAGKKDTSKQSKPFEPKSIVLPSLAWKFDIRVQHLQFQQDKNLIELDKIHIYNPSPQSLAINVQGQTPSTLLRHIKLIPFEIQAQIHWHNDSLDHNLKFCTSSDTLLILGRNPLTQIENLSTTISLNTPNVDHFLQQPLKPFKISAIGLQTQIAYNLRHKSLSSQITTNFKTSALDQSGLVPAFEWHNQIELNHSPNNTKIAALIKANGSQNQILNARILSDLKTAKIDAQTQNWRWKISHFSLPLNISHLDAFWDGKNIQANLITPEGSKVKALGNPKQGVFKLDGVFADHEPWIYTWTGKQLQLRNANAQLIFRKGWNLQGDVHAKVENAWTTEADLVDVKIYLDKRHIKFPKITTHFRGHSPIFTGHIDWQNHHTRLFFESQSSVHTARFEMNVPGDMDVTAIDYPIDELPLKFIPKDFELKGKVNGQLTLPYQGHLYALASFDGTYPFHNKTLPVKFSGIMRESPENFELEQFKTNIYTDEVSGSFAWSKDTSLPLLQRFQKIFLNNIQVDLSHYNFNPEQQLAGEIYGELLWDYRFSNYFPRINSKINFYQISLADTSGKNIVQIPSGNILTDTNQNLLINSNFSLGDKNDFSGTFETKINPLFPKDTNINLRLNNFDDLKPWLEMSRIVTTKVNTDVGGQADLSLQTSSVNLLDAMGNETDQSIQKLTGGIKVSGKWLLPVKNLEISNSNLNARLDWTLNGGMDSLYFKILKNQVTMTYPNIPDQILNISGSLKNNDLNVDLFLNDSTKNKFTMSAQYDLKSQKIKQLYGFSPKYVIKPDPDQFIGLYNLEMRHRSESTGERFPIKFDSSYYQKYSPKTGLIRASANGQINYFIPSNPLDNQVLAGNIFISKAVYEHTLKYDIVDISKALVDKETYNNFFANIRNFLKPSQTQFSNKSKPILLDLNISDKNSDSLWILTNIATLPLSINLKVAGPIQQPVLQGGISNTESGKFYATVGSDDAFEISDFGLNWNSTSADRGEILFDSHREVQLCEIDSTQSQNNHSDSVCNIQLSLKGPLDNAKFLTEAQCANGQQPNTTSILAGITVQNCISNDTKIDLAKILFKQSDQQASKIASKFGQKYTPFEKIQFNGLSNSFINPKDSTELKFQFKIPWIDSKNWVFNGGYVFPGENPNNAEGNTGETMNSNNAGYGYLGIDWIIWQNNKNGRNDKIYWETSGISKNNNSSGSDAGSAESTNNFALRTGLSWQRLFWEFCIFGFGYCETEQK